MSINVMRMTNEVMTYMICHIILFLEVIQEPNLNGSCFLTNIVHILKVLYNIISLRLKIII